MLFKFYKIKKILLIFSLVNKILNNCSFKTIKFNKKQMIQYQMKKKNVEKNTPQLKNIWQYILALDKNWDSFFYFLMLNLSDKTTFGKITFPNKTQKMQKTDSMAGKNEIVYDHFS